jgi:hypothetical protein
VKKLKVKSENERERRMLLSRKREEIKERMEGGIRVLRSGGRKVEVEEVLEKEEEEKGSKKVGK